MNSAAHSLASINVELIALLADLKFSTLNQLEDGLTPQTVNYLYRGRLSSWYSKNHPKIVSSAQSLASKGPAMVELSKLTTSAYSSSSGKTQLTPGNVFKAYIELLPDAMREIGKLELAVRVMTALTEIEQQIKGFSEETPRTAPKKKSNPLLAEQAAQANDLYEQLLGSIDDERLRHDLREKTKRADNKLGALMKLIKPS